MGKKKHSKPRSSKDRVQLWHNGALFHNATRFPRKPNKPRVDRLAGILKRGIVAPGACPDGLVHSDLNLVMSGCGVPYDRIVFLHRYGPQSWLYTMYEPGRFAVFVDPEHPVLTAEEMPKPWLVLCQDEVYVHDGVPAEKLIAVAVDPADGPEVLREFQADFERLAIPLCHFDGTVLWRPK